MERHYGGRTVSFAIAARGHLHRPWQMCPNPANRVSGNYRANNTGPVPAGQFHSTGRASGMCWAKPAWRFE
jgi:hypothetical protein